MKLIKLLLLSMLFTFASCSSSTQESALDFTRTEMDENSLDFHRGASVTKNAIQRFSLDSVAFNFESLEMIKLVENATENEDVVTIHAINQALLGVEKEFQLLNVNFTMSDKPIDNGSFIFGISSEISNELELQMLDEEGYVMVANNTLSINKGENYKALNVNSLANGEYIFRLIDKDGKELTKTVVIEK